MSWVTTGFILLTISSATLCAGILASLTQSRKVVVLLIARHFLHFVEAKEGVGAKLNRADFLAKNQPHAVLQVSIGLSQAALSTTWSAEQPLSADLTQVAQLWVTSQPSCSAASPWVAAVERLQHILEEG